MVPMPTTMHAVPVQSAQASDPLLEIDMGTFDPWRVQTARHRLADHPLLQAAALAELALRLEARGSIRTHSNDAIAGTPFGDAPRLHPNTQGARETVLSIQQARAWMSLLNVQTDPTYRALVGAVLDSVQPQVESRDPGMCHRAGWIFVSSPNTVTPFHFDKEHNFILQIEGRKRVYVWEPDDVVVASEHARDRFHHRHERDLLRWSEEFRARARVFDLQPGQGAYMPSTSPHLVENGDAPSITVSFTYYTDATRRDAQLHKAHALLRGIGIAPAPVGSNPGFDRMAFAGIAAMLRTRALASRIVGNGRSAGPARFAHVAR